MRKVTVSQLGPVLRGLGELAGDDYTKILKKLSMDAFTQLVRRSAKDTGFLRSNWDVTTGAAPNANLTGTVKGSYAPASWGGTQIKIDSHVVIYNNTAYAMYLEKGTPRMRAQPMVEPTRRQVELQAIALSKAFTKKKYNV